MPVRQFLSRTDFTNPDTALDLYGNSLRSAFSYDVYEGKTVFDAVVLTKPIFLVDAEIRATEDSPGFQRTNAEDPNAGRLNKFSFKARILPSDCPSPHGYLPDPCDIQVAEEYDDISKLYNLHTTFISSDDYTRSNSVVPKIGDIVRVELVKNIFSFNLQFGTFLSIRTNNRGVLPSSDDDADPASEWNCTTAIDLFYESDTFGGIREGMSDAEMRTTARAFLTRMRAELATTEVYVSFEIPSHWLGDETATEVFGDDDFNRPEIQNQRLGLTKEIFEENSRYDPYELKYMYDGPVSKQYFATGTDSTGLTFINQLCGPWRTSNPNYPMEKCVRCEIGDRATVLHPEFCNYISAAVEAARLQVPDAVINISPNMRKTEDQIYLRIFYNCGTTYENIMNNRAAPCRVPVALPGTSNHEIGLAVDLGGTLTAPSTNEAKKTDPPSAARQSALYRWMRANIHNKASITVTSIVDGTTTKDLGNIKNMDAEPWHWSWNGG